MPNATPTTSRAARGLAGTVAVPGDKSISHRALMLGALAVGETRVEGLLEGEDVLATAAAMRALGAEVERQNDGAWTVAGVGVGGMAEPAGVLDLGNSGTAARLICGILAGQPFTAFMTGDASLCRRPMNRVIAPLAEMGAQFLSRSGGRMPLAITGAHPLVPIEYDMPVASAQVKSAVLFAGLSAPGATRVIEPKPTRDHSERMLAHFGATVSTEDLPGGRRRVSVQGFPELAGKPIRVPGDISSAAFPLVAALLVPGSAVTLTGVGVNPLRTGLLDTLIEMGADIAVTGVRDDGGEPVADIVVKSSSLKGVAVPPERAPSMIDEYPILAVAAACARGTTRMTGLEELRVKESDRLAAIANGLRAAGVAVEDGPDWLAVHGTGEPPPGGALVPANLDHRIAMAFLVLGTVAAKPVSVDDATTIDTSFPGFADLMNGLGADIAAGGAP